MREANEWKLQDAKARFSEVVRRARAGKPQHVTVHGKEAVVVVDPQRFESDRNRHRSQRLPALSSARRNIAARLKASNLIASRRE